MSISNISAFSNASVVKTGWSFSPPPAQAGFTAQPDLKGNAATQWLDKFQALLERQVLRNQQGQIPGMAPMDMESKREAQLVFDQRLVLLSAQLSTAAQASGRRDLALLSALRDMAGRLPEQKLEWEAEWSEQSAQELETTLRTRADAVTVPGSVDDLLFATLFDRLDNFMTGALVNDTYPYKPGEAGEYAIFQQAANMYTQFYSAFSDTIVSMAGSGVVETVGTDRVKVNFFKLYSDLLALKQKYGNAELFSGSQSEAANWATQLGISGGAIFNHVTQNWVVLLDTSAIDGLLKNLFNKIYTSGVDQNEYPMIVHHGYDYNGSDYVIVGEQVWLNVPVPHSAITVHPGHGYYVTVPIEVSQLAWSTYTSGHDSQKEQMQSTLQKLVELYSKSNREKENQLALISQLARAHYETAGLFAKM